MFYIALKHLHLTTVAITIILFLFRSALMLWWSKGLRWRWLRILPHANDSILLLSGIGLMLLTHQYPFAQSWLTAKLVALVAYIVLGSLALKRGAHAPDAPAGSGGGTTLSGLSDCGCPHPQLDSGSALTPPARGSNESPAAARCARDAGGYQRHSAACCT